MQNISVGVSFQALIPTKLYKYGKVIPTLGCVIGEEPWVKNTNILE